MGFNEKLLIGASAGAITPSENFTPFLYTGTGGARSITGIGFDPDFVWAKTRTFGSTTSHRLVDSVRGDHQNLYLPNSNAESTDTAGISLITDGFAFGGNEGANLSGAPTVAWIWKAGGEPTATNSAGVGNAPTSGSVMIDGAASSSALAGSIAATKISANTAAGFSIVTYTGASTTSTVAHGLSSAPELIIVKGRTVAQGWPTLYNDGSNSYTMRVSETGQNDNANKNLMFGNGSSHIAPTSSVFTVGNSDETNQGYNYVAYCFHSVDGYCKIGTYNGSSSLHTVDFGFAPAFVIIKRTDASGGWRLFDYLRDSGTGDRRVDHSLQSNDAGNEYDNSGNPDEYLRFTDTGLKFPTNSTNPDVNNNGSTYIYIAWARD